MMIANIRKDILNKLNESKVEQFQETKRCEITESKKEGIYDIKTEKEKRRYIIPVTKEKLEEMKNKDGFSVIEEA